MPVAKVSNFYNYFPSKILKNIPVLVIGCIVLIDFYKVSH